jgi:hypothetical protein
VRLLKETLTHCRHSFLIFPDFLRDANQHAKFWWQVNILALLLNFEKRLVKVQNLLVVLLPEILNHRNCGASFALLELAR